MQKNLKAKAKGLVLISKLLDIGFNFKGDKARGTIFSIKKNKNESTIMFASVGLNLNASTGNML